MEIQVLPIIGIPITKMRLFHMGLIFIIGILISVSQCLYIEMGPIYIRHAVHYQIQWPLRDVEVISQVHFPKLFHLIDILSTSYETSLI